MSLTARVAVTSKRTSDLELFQLQADQGPCLDCHTTGQTVAVADVQAEARRWLRFTSAATEAGIDSVHAVPMRAGGTVLGALGLFSTDVGELNDADLLITQTLAHIACVAILQGHLTPVTVVPPVRTALNSRIVVEQAKGYLRERLDVSVQDAFKLLRRYAGTHDDHLTEVAWWLLNTPDARQTFLEDMETAGGGLPRQRISRRSRLGRRIEFWTEPNASG